MEIYFLSPRNSVSVCFKVVMLGTYFKILFLYLKVFLSSLCDNSISNVFFFKFYFCLILIHLCYVHFISIYMLCVLLSLCFHHFCVLF